MEKFSNIETLARHAMRTLPDSISERKSILSAIVRALPRGDERRIQAALLLRQLHAHEKAQQEFAFAFLK